MRLRDRFRRWWSPAQWENEHTAERKQREQRQKGALGTHRRTMYPEAENFGPAGRIGNERDFKKPR